MSANKIITILSIIVLLLSCEKEKTEYKLSDDSEFFYGFYGFNSNIIIHDESISYYSQDSNKVFGNLFEFRNGRKLGKGIHSYKSFRLYHYDKIFGVITIEHENKVEIVDAKSFLSIQQFSLESPRDIAISEDESVTTILISCGNTTESGKLALIKAYNYREHDEVEIENIEIKTGNKPGKIFMHNNYIYVFSTGENDTSNTIAKIYHEGFTRFQKVEDIYVGENPVSYDVFEENETGFNNKSLAILCKGNATNPASIVKFNLILNKVTSTHSFKTLDLQPQSFYLMQKYGDIYRLANNDIYRYNGDVIWFYANNRLYEATLSRLEDAVVVFNRNISDFTSILPHDKYLSVSRDTVNSTSMLYISRFEPPSTFDSIPINAYAKKIE